MREEAVGKGLMSFKGKKKVVCSTNAKKETTSRIGKAVHAGATETVGDASFFCDWD